MKKILILLLFISTISFAQVTPSRNIRVPDSTTQFLETIPRGSLLFNTNNGNVYASFLGLASTKTLNTCALNSELILIGGINKFINNGIGVQPANFNISGSGVIGSSLWVKGMSITFDALAGGSTRYVVVDQYGNLEGGATVSSTATSGTYAPTLISQTGVSYTTFSSATYQRIGNIVHVTINGSFTGSIYPATIQVTLPVPYSSGNGDHNTCGSGSVSEDYRATLQPGIVSIGANVSGTVYAWFDFNPTSSTSDTFSFSFDYAVE